MSTKRFETILVDIDTQNDFMDPRGSLYIDQADAIADNVRRLISWADRQGVPVVSSVDTHVENDPEFEQFPPHCIVGTWGHQKISGTLVEPNKKISLGDKQMDVSCELDVHRQLVFEKSRFSIFDNPSAAQTLQEIQAETFIVCGVATDYCVKAAVEGLLERGKRVRLVVDAIAGVDKAKSEDIIKVFKAQGVKMVTTSEVIGE